MSITNGNVIGHDQFKEIMNETLDYVAGAVSQTLGPHGHNAIIQTMSGVYSTKDGWHTLQNINFNGDVIRNSIKFMIESVAQSIVLTVGDGSTTSTIAANALNKLINTVQLPENTTIRQLEETLTKCVNTIIAKLYEQAFTIDTLDPYDEIYKIALVSTNWDAELANMIAGIYDDTHNPIIKVMDSGTDTTSVEYIEGYDLAGSLVLPEYYATDREHGKAIMENPIILVFNHNVQDRFFTAAASIAQIFQMMRRNLVLVAPGFESAFLNRLSVTNNNLIKQNKPILNIIPCKVINNFENDRDCIRDFCKLTGANPISVNDEDFNEFVKELVDVMLAQPQVAADGDDDDTVAKQNEQLAEAKQLMTNSAMGYVNNIGGTCDELFIDGNGLLAKGLPFADSSVIEDTRNTIRGEIDRKIKECDALTMLTDDIRMKRVRLGKLACKMGIIKVGGYGSANLKAKRDALDDATRACEAAYRDGYNKGGCLSILSAIRDICPDAANVPIDGGALVTPVLDTDQKTLDVCIYSVIFNAFAEVFRTLFINKYGAHMTFDKMVPVVGDNLVNTYMHIYEIIETCTRNNWGFDTIENQFDDDASVVINPVNVDVEALKACLRLVLISVTSSQFIFKHFGPVAEVDLKEVK